MTKRASASPARARIWDPRARFLEHAEASGVAVPDAEKRATSRTAARLAARREFELHKQVKRVRSELSRIFSGSRASTSSTHSKGAPLLVYERWLARSALAAEDASSSSSPPLLPRGDPEGGLRRDLIRHGASEEDAERGAADAVKKSKDAAERWAKRCEEIVDEEDDVEICDRSGFLTLQLRGLKPYVKVTKKHISKLRALYCRTCRGGKPLSEDLNSDEYRTFAFAVFALLMRYETLGGAGYQSALGEDAFDVLHEKLGVSCECFASPLNARYASFCSAFLDVDVYFGSLGSFFSDNFAPTRGSFEMNPPFVPETMSRAVAKVRSLLERAENADEALSFVVVVPAWRDCHFWTALLECPLLRHEPDIVDAESHGFCDGAQHTRPSHERHRVSSYDTGVFYLQTTSASRKWRCDPDVRRDVVLKMKNALGSCATVRELERRYRPTPPARKKRSKPSR